MEKPIAKIKRDSPQQQLYLLADLLQEVFIPLEANNPEIRKTLQKFVSQIHQTSQQVSGTVTIELPDIVSQVEDEAAIKDGDLMGKYISVM